MEEPSTNSNIIPCLLYLKQASEIENIEAFIGSSEPSVQGSLLIQSLLKLHESANNFITSAILSLPAPSLLSLGHNPISSRIFDAFLESPSVSARERRKLVLAFKDHFPALVDDRIGSRVGERLWAAADPYLKEKIASSLIPHETRLVGSRYGKFFVRGLNLFLLKKDPEAWKSKQAQSLIPHTQAIRVAPLSKDGADGTKIHTSIEISDAKKRKRDVPKDEIDVVFSSALGKRQKKDKESLPGQPAEDQSQSVHGDEAELKSPAKSVPPMDKELDGVLTAIRNAPRDAKVKPKEKKKKQRSIY